MCVPFNSTVLNKDQKNINQPFYDWIFDISNTCCYYREIKAQPHLHGRLVEAVDSKKIPQRSVTKKVFATALRIVLWLTIVTPLVSLVFKLSQVRAYTNPLSAALKQDLIEEHRIQVRLVRDYENKTETSLNFNVDPNLKSFVLVLFKQPGIISRGVVVEVNSTPITRNHVKYSFIYNEGIWFTKDQLQNATSVEKLISSNPDFV